VLLVQHSRELTKLTGTCATDHRGIFLAELHELFAETLFLGARAGISEVEKLARGHTASEPFGLGQADNEGSEEVLDFSVGEGLADADEGAGGLLTNNSLVRLGKLFEEG
jgi:hypothetical protein